MSSEDGYFDGYIPVTKEGLNTAVKELQKELKQLEEKSDKKDQRIWKELQELRGQITKAEYELERLRDEEEIKKSSAKLKQKLAEAELERLENLSSGPKEGKEEKSEKFYKLPLLL